MTEENFELDAEIFSEFISESLEHLEDIEQKLVEYEENPQDSELMAAIFRGFHSIKGSSGFLQLKNINKLSHQLETLLDELRKGEREVTPSIMDVLFQGCNLLTKMIEDVNSQLAENRTPTNDEDDETLNEILAELDKIFSGKNDEPSNEEEVENDNASTSESGSEPESNPEEQAETSVQEASQGYKITPELMNEFQVEAGEHLESCDQVLVKLSEKPDDPESVNDVFRHIHSVKGTASYLGLTNISELAHAAESMLELLRKQENVKMSDTDLDLLFEALDVLREMVANREVSNEKVKNLINRLNERKQAIEEGKTEEPEKTPKSSDDPVEVFLDFSNQQLETLKECMKKNEDESEDQENLVQVMFRAAQSIKNSANYMGLEEIETKAKIMTDTIESIKNGELELNFLICDFINDAIAEIEKLLENLSAEDIAKIENNAQSVSQEIDSKEKETLKTSDSDKTETIHEIEHEKPVVSESEKTEEKEKVQTEDKKEDKQPVQTPIKKEAVKPKKPAQSAPAKKSSKPATATPKTMRVNQALLDTFMNLVGELIVTRNAFGHITRRLDIGEQERAEAIKDLRDTLLALSRVSEEMQRTVMAMRMVPIRNVFQKFPRMLRDLTRKTGKQAQIILEGEDTEIDKGVAEDLADPLVHIIRNCVDHGLETPEERIKVGKPEKGTIILRASHEGNFIIIDIIDDGKGINTSVVLEKAIEKGLVSQEQAMSLSHEEICNFIFQPGFSTAQKITDISGRGVGMDVVMTNLKKIKGNVRVNSEEGKGTEVRLEVPLTLALIEALLVKSSDQTFAMPLDSVTETVKVTNKEVQSLLRKRAILLRGEVVTVIELSSLLGIHRATGTIQDEMTLLIVRMGNNKIGVIVDEIQRKEEVLVKPLAEYLAAIPGLAGASILGDGRSILILDPGELIALALNYKEAV